MRIILRISKKKLEDEDFPHELFLITRQKTKIRIAFAKNTSTDIKLIKAEISKIIQSGGFFSFGFSFSFGFLETIYLD